MSVTFRLVKNGTFLGPDDELSFNVANGNAIMLLDMVGVEPWSEDGLVGRISDLARLEHACQEILHVLRANPDLDAGRQHEVLSQIPRMVRCALPDGYLLDRVGRLRRMAEEGLLRDAELHFA